MSLTPDHTLADVAKALGMSERWVRQRIAEGASHQRYGHKIRFTDDQLEALRAQHSRNEVIPQSITTGRKRRAS